MQKRDQEENHDSSDHIHQHENTTIVSRHKPEDQIKSDKILHLADTSLCDSDSDSDIYFATTLNIYKHN